MWNIWVCQVLPSVSHYLPKGLLFSGLWISIKYNNACLRMQDKRYQDRMTINTENSHIYLLNILSIFILTEKTIILIIRLSSIWKQFWYIKTANQTGFGSINGSTAISSPLGQCREPLDSSNWPKNQFLQQWPQSFFLYPTSWIE